MKNSLRFPKKLDIVWRRITADARTLPDFIIIGAQKAGTTSLYEYMAQHPQVIPALNKETYYFAERYTRGLRWYRSHFALYTSVKRRSGRLGLPVVTGEATPYYMYHPEAPKRIHDLCPAVKLIVILRNPTDRTYSHYNYSVKRGEETVLNFEQAINLEEARLKGEVQRLQNEPGYESYAHKFQSYLGPGRYIEQLREIDKYFSRDQVLVLESAEFYADPQAACDEVAVFLGLGKARIADLRPRKVTPSDKLDARLRKRLNEYFAPSNRELFDHLGVSYDWN